MKYGKLSRKDIAELERLAETPEGVAALTEFVEKQKEARSAYKRYVKIINKKEKTPNEIRAAFIEKCKRYVKKYGVATKFVELPDDNGWLVKGIFSYGISSNIEGVRNEYVEKANALAWLIKDYDFVEKTRNAPQPTVAIGQVIEFNYFVRKEKVEVKSIHYNGAPYVISDWLHTSKYEIIDDTHAIYKEVTK